MDLKHSLLQNEIKHLGQIIQTLSYEMIVLQDFLKAEFGSKFESYRSGYSSSEAYLSPALSKHGRKEKQNNRSCDNSNDKRKNNKPGPSQRNSVNDDESSDDLSDDDQDPSWFSSPSEFIDNNAVANDHNQKYEPVSAEAKSLLVRSVEFENDDLKVGRRRSKIWKFYDVVKLNSDKISARCHMCRCLVSARAARMAEHHIKCKRNKKSKLEKVIKRESLQESNLEAKKIRKATAEENISLESPHVSESENTSEKETKTNTNDNDAGYIEAQKNRGGLGRLPDVIWQYFEILTKNNFKKAKCKSCGMLVSPKAVRLKQHKIICVQAETGLAVTSGSESMDED